MGDGSSEPAEVAPSAGALPPLAIEAAGLAKRYPNGVEALAGVDFAIGWGVIFAYLGRNGSGKTTTVRVLTTLTPPSAGTARVAGVDVVGDPAGARKVMGVTMQEAALDHLMTGMEHLQLVGQLWGHRAPDARQRATELLESFGLTDAANRRISTYSGGMRRRLDIATALFNRPRVLFLDEPTTGLDPQSRRAVWNTVRDARDEGTAVFLTTQYLAEAEELADTVAILDAGRVVASGTVSQLKATFGRTTVRLRVAEVDTAAVRVAVGDHPVRQVGGGCLEVDLMGAAAESHAVIGLLGRLRQDEVGVTELGVSQASLEDVFVRLTGDRVSAGNGGNVEEGAGIGALGGGRM